MRQGEIALLLDDLPYHFLRRIRLKWPNSRQHFVENNSEAKQIRSAVDAMRLALGPAPDSCRPAFRQNNPLDRSARQVQRHRNRPGTDSRLDRAEYLRA